MATYFGFDAYNVDRGSDPFVFISYKSEDWEKVAVYARYLHDHGINVWYDNGLHAGSDWESYLMSVIEKPNCKAVLLFVSAKVADSTVIPLETTQARACKKPTVAIYLEPGLNLETLLNKAIRVYVEQRQSVNAYIGTENSVCAQVLEAAKMAMDDKPVVASTSADALWKNANMFLMNARRSRSEEDTGKARSYLFQLTEQEPSDYRGWLGLAMCACLRRPESLEGAHEQLKEGAKYYSYVVASGADDIASAEYTEVKSQLWEDTLGFIRQAFISCTGLEELKQLREQTERLGAHFGHTEPYLRSDYERSVAEMDEELLRAEKEAEAERLKLEKEAAEKAEKLKRESAYQNAITQSEWRFISPTKVSLKKYNGDLTVFVVPDYVDGAQVVEIGWHAFIYNEKITSVTIPNGVKRVDDLAFSGCTNLISVSLPLGLESIGYGAFSDCASLSTLEIPFGVSSIEDHAFSGCTSLLSVCIPFNVNRIGNNAFENCSQLTSITLHSVKHLGRNVFKGCERLTVNDYGGVFSKTKRVSKRCGVKYKRIKPQN